MRTALTAAVAALTIAGVAGTAGAQQPAPAAGASAAPTARPRPARLPADSLERARRYTAWFYHSAADSLFAQMTPDMQAGMPVASIQNSMAQFATRAGTEVELVSERWVTRSGMRQYWRTARYDGNTELVMLRFALTSEGKIAGIGMNPAANAPAIDPE